MKNKKRKLLYVVRGLDRVNKEDLVVYGHIGVGGLILNLAAFVFKVLSSSQICMQNNSIQPVFIPCFLGTLGSVNPVL